MLKKGWKVRAVTRNVESEAAKTLASQGAELVTADYDDESSLVKAFDVCSFRSATLALSMVIDVCYRVQTLSSP